MQLSILIGTNRSSLLACSRIAQACSWAGQNIEVIIRDNSGDARKRALLPQFQRDNCNIIIAEPCDALTNVTEIINLARGEFVFLLGDDDFGFDQAIAALPKTIAQLSHDQSVAGITGIYAIESPDASAVVDYKNIDSADAIVRLAGYLECGGPNVMIYAPVRREIFKRVFAFTKKLPFLFSFHDQIICLLYLLNGRFVRLNRLLYLYDAGPWSAAESAQKRDLGFYQTAGLDPAINKLHWFICAFEGAVLIRNSDIFSSVPLGQRQAMADIWFSTMYRRFQGNPRYTFDSTFADEAEKLCTKLRAVSGQLSFQSMLAAISGFISLFSKSRAQTYFDFWDAIVSKGVPAIRESSVYGSKAASGR